MSLVNLAHVCSHLQNASMARLGLTSVPYTKLHLSIMALLHKQGFISSVKLGGPLPPVSSFGPGQFQSHPGSRVGGSNSLYGPQSPEAALMTMATHRLSRAALQARSFDEEAIDFAEEHGIKTFEEMRAEGFDERVVAFIAHVREQVDDVARELERDEWRQRYVDGRESEPESEDAPHERYLQARERILEGLSPAKKAIFEQYDALPEEELLATQFSDEVLAEIAGPAIYKEPWEIQRNGITIQAMGLRIENQPIELPLTENQDNNLLDEEGVVTQENRASRRLWLGMKYYNSSPVLSKARMVSKPTKRIWLSSRELGHIVRGHRAGEVRPLTQIGEIMVISTDKGIMEARECVERKIGGQPLCRVW